MTRRSAIAMAAVAPLALAAGRAEETERPTAANWPGLCRVHFAGYGTTYYDDERLTVTNETGCPVCRPNEPKPYMRPTWIFERTILHLKAPVDDLVTLYDAKKSGMVQWASVYTYWQGKVVEEIHGSPRILSELYPHLKLDVEA